MPLFDGVDLEIMPGEALGLMGPSGIGKSTLARLCLGLERPNQGGVFFHGRDLAGLDRHGWMDFRRRVQIVWQEPALYLNPYMNVAELVDEPLLIHGLGDGDWRRHRVSALLDKVGLTPKDGGKRIHQLSGGQCQRVALARALACGPEFLVCDEVLNGLDTISQAHLVRLIKGLVAETGMALLFISHDRALVAHLCAHAVHLGKK